MLDKFSILNRAKYFSLGIFVSFVFRNINNYVVFVSSIKHIKCFHGTAQTCSWKSIDNILDIHKYLMKRLWYKIMFELIKKNIYPIIK